jgi:hypothetical protein
MKNLNDYVDTYGLITSGPPGFDGGDTSSRNGTYAYCNQLTAPNPTYNKTFLDKIMDPTTKLYRRHPDPNKWYSNVETYSRDQFIPVLCLLIADQTQTEHRRNLFLKHLMHAFLFAWNVRENNVYPTPAETLAKGGDASNSYAWKVPDPCGPQIWSLWIRAFRFWLFYPLLIFFDLETLIGNMVRYFQGSNADIDNQNDILASHASVHFMPTPTSLLAFWILKKCPLQDELTQFFTDRPDQPPIEGGIENLLK